MGNGQVGSFAVVGGGIIGVAIARELALRKAGRVTVLEKESTLGLHASGRNSGVLHSGINQKPGSLKARLCVEGSRILRQYCRDRGVAMHACGTLVAARTPQEESVLEELLAMGRECGVPGLQMLTAEEFAGREPACVGKAALYSPTGAVVDARGLLEALAEEARGLGVEFRMSREWKGAEGGMLQTNEGTLRAEHVVNCGGLFADRIAHAMGVGLDYRIVPFRGEYMEVEGCDVRGMVYRPPDLRFPFLSIHLTRGTDGRVLAGPSAVPSMGRENYDKRLRLGDLADTIFSRQFLRMWMRPEMMRLALANAGTSLSKKSFCKQVQSLAPEVKPSQLRPSRAGIRAQMVDRQGRLVQDMMVEYLPRSTHVLNAVSPGMTCSLAFAREVVNRVLP